MFSASTDLIALVQSQMILIAQTLGVVSSVMYIAQKTPEGGSQWVELVAYPQGTQASLPRLLPTETTAIVRQKRIVVPLVYEEVMLGLLVSEKGQAWTPQEQHQMEEVAQTLSIACAIDQRCQWLLHQQEEMFSENSRALRQQEDFLANLLHQLRNPVAVLRTFGQLLLKRVLPEDPNHRIVSGILRETNHLQELLTGAADLPPLLPSQSANFLLPAAPPQPINLNEILEPLISSIGAIAQEKQIRFQALLPDFPVLVLAFPTGLREVLHNLLDNALKYTPTNGEILLLVNVTKEEVTIQIRDTGMGIPTADLPYLFARNFRGRQSQGSISGSGLGLAIAKQLVEQMQGTIGVESEEGKGSTFTVKLLRKSPSTLLPHKS